MSWIYWTQQTHSMLQISPDDHCMSFQTWYMLLICKRAPQISQSTGKWLCCQVWSRCTPPCNMLARGELFRDILNKCVRQIWYKDSCIHMRCQSNKASFAGGTLHKPLHRKVQDQIDWLTCMMKRKFTFQFRNNLCRILNHKLLKY